MAGMSNIRTGTLLAGAHRAPAGANPMLIVLVALALLLVATGISFTSYCRLGSEAAALRESAMRAVPGVWHKKVAFNIGPMTTLCARSGSRLFPLPLEARAAITSLQSVQVGVYELQGRPGPRNATQLFAATDRAMSSFGWDRVVGVAEKASSVAIYFPQGNTRPERTRCCILVLDERDLVVISAQGNLNPLLPLVRAKLDSLVPVVCGSETRS